MSDNSFEYRKNLLLENFKHMFQQNNTYNISDDEIKNNIIEYTILLQKFKNKNISEDEKIKLNEKHNFFYGSNFDFESSIYQSNTNSDLVDIFKRDFKIIETIIKENDTIIKDILNYLLPILTFYYNKNKDKQVIINEYLDNIIIPSINSYRNVITGSTIGDYDIESRKNIETKLKNIVESQIIEEEKKTEQKEEQKERREREREREIEQIREKDERIERKREIEQIIKIDNGSERERKIEAKKTEETEETDEIILYNMDNDYKIINDNYVIIKSKIDEFNKNYDIIIKNYNIIKIIENINKVIKLKKDLNNSLEKEEDEEIRITNNKIYTLTQEIDKNIETIKNEDFDIDKYLNIINKKIYEALNIAGEIINIITENEKINNKYIIKFTKENITKNYSYISQDTKNKILEYIKNFKENNNYIITEKKELLKKKDEIDKINKYIINNIIAVLKYEDSILKQLKLKEILKEGIIEFEDENKIKQKIYIVRNNFLNFLYFLKYLKIYNDEIYNDEIFNIYNSNIYDIINNNKKIKTKEKYIYNIINKYIYDFLQKKNTINFNNILDYIIYLNNRYSLKFDNNYLNFLKTISNENKKYDIIIDILFKINLYNLIQNNNSKKIYDNKNTYILINILLLKKNNLFYEKYIYYKNDFLYQNYYNILNNYDYLINKNVYIDNVYLYKILKLYLNSIFNNNENFNYITFKKHIEIFNNITLKNIILNNSFFKNDIYIYELFNIISKNLSKINNKIIHYLFTKIILNKKANQQFKDLLNNLKTNNKNNIIKLYKKIFDYNIDSSYLKSLDKQNISDFITESINKIITEKNIIIEEEEIDYDDEYIDEEYEENIKIKNKNKEILAIEFAINKKTIFEVINQYIKKTDEQLEKQTSEIKEKTSAKETSTEQTSAEETSTKETSAEEKETEQTIKKQTSAEETSAEEQIRETGENSKTLKIIPEIPPEKTIAKVESKNLRQIADEEQIKIIEKFIDDIKNSEEENKENLINEFIDNILSFKQDNIENIKEYKSNLQEIINSNLKKLDILKEKLVFLEARKLGGKKIINNNDIKLIDIYKFYYNYISIYNDDNRIINNIYKLYFIINIYSNYYKNTEKYIIIENIKDIIDNNNYKNYDINDIIKNINKENEEIYKEYIKLIENNDNILKYYYVENDKYNEYLNINFIYKIYKNIEEEDINIKIEIDENEILINKTYNEISEEIKEFIKNKEYILYTYDIIDKNSNIIYKEDIKYLIDYIYYYSKNDEIIIDNINDLLNYIIIKILTCEEEEIILNINNKNYKITNIKNHLYKINLDEEKIIKIKLNKKEEYLLNKLLNNNSKYLFAILANEYYYINFELSKKFIYNMYINYEIIDLLENTKEFKRNLINYSFYNFMPISKFNNYSIINTNNNKILLIINYSILLSSSIYTNINLYNYISLIYIYFILKKLKDEINEINEINEYNGNYNVINDYKYLLLSVDIIEYIKRCIIEIQSKLVIKYDINKYIYHILHFKENKFINSLNIKPSINIDFITNLYKNNEIIIKDNKYYDDIYNCLLLILKICIIPNINNYNSFNDVIKIQYIYLLPILKELSATNIHINNIEKIILSIKINDIIIKIKNNRTIFGGNNENTSDDKETSNDKESSDDKESSNGKLLDVKVSTDTTPNIDNIIKNLELIGIIEKKINKIDINTYIEIFQNFIIKFSYINIENESNSIYETSEILGKIPEYSDPNFPKSIAKINSIIKNNIELLNEEINNLKNNNNELQKNIENIQIDIIKLKEYVKLLENYKDSDDKNITDILKKFEISKNQKVDIFEIKKTIIDYLQEYINYFKEIIDLYVLSINDILKIYLSLQYNIEVMMKQYNIYLEKNNINKRGGYNNNYNNKLIKGGIDNSKKINNINKLYNEKNLPLNIEKFKNNFFQKDNKNIEEIIDKRKEILKKIDDIKKDYKKLKTSNIIPQSIEKELVLKDFQDKNGNNLFEKLLYQYDKDYKETTEEIANNNFYDNIVKNNLDPEVELKVNIYDKLIFLLLVILLRIVAIYITNYLIDNGTIINIKIAIYYYTIIYLILYVGVVIIINIDVFRLRLLFNYLNMHINSVNIFNHFIINIIISYIIYLLIINLTDEKERTKLSKNEKLKLQYKINILTITIIVFIIIMVLVI